MTDTVVIAEERDESGHRFSWGLAFAGAFAATAVTFFLLTLGAGVGLLLVNPVTHSGPSTPVFLTGGAIYFLAAQAFGFAVGGHLAGRLLGPLVETRMQEDFRAGAHGLTVWAITVVTSVVLIGLAGLATGSHVAALYGAAAARTETATPTNYLVDKLYRPTGGAASEAARGEANRILAVGLANGETLASEDRARLITLVSRNSGASRDEASARVDAMQADIQAKTRLAADTARKAASYASLWIAFSLLFGLIVAIFAAVSARIEDDRESFAELRPAATY
ncbi:MAG TPA: hypothetical protein VGM36_16620 [Rhizomicrobium sp.]|jgi:hypothetical protein